MKKSVRILLTAVCVLMCLCLPFILCSATSLAEDMETAEAKALPVDFSAGSVPDPDGWTEDGYSDDTITVRVETREEDGVVWRIIYVDIAHPSQLRTATAGKPTANAKTVAKPSSMAESKNAIVAINGDNFCDDPDKTTFEYRQGVKVRFTKYNKKKDVLIIDMDGNFHTFIKSGADGKAELERYLDEGGTIMDAFTFGPVLVKGGMSIRMDTGYGYNPNGREPRAAIGQRGELSYVLVVAEGRNKNSNGVTHQELADFMFELGCVEAYNLDGGNSATLVFHGEFYMDRTPSSERSQSDIIYFASARDAE